MTLGQGDVNFIGGIGTQPLTTAYRVKGDLVLDLLVRLHLGLTHFRALYLIVYSNTPTLPRGFGVENLL